MCSSDLLTITFAEYDKYFLTAKNARFFRKVRNELFILIFFALFAYILANFAVKLSEFKNANSQWWQNDFCRKIPIIPRFFFDFNRFWVHYSASIVIYFIGIENLCYLSFFRQPDAVCSMHHLCHIANDHKVFFFGISFTDIS